METARGLAEERRLFYVAVTRPQNELILTWAERDQFSKDAFGSEFLEFAAGVETEDASTGDALGVGEHDDEVEARNIEGSQE